MPLQNRNPNKHVTYPFRAMRLGEVVTFLRDRDLWAGRPHEVYEKAMEAAERETGFKFKVKLTPFVALIWRVK